VNYSTPLQGKPVQLDYLDYLIDDCNRERELSEFIKYQDETTAGITYLTPLKDFTGYLRGYYEMLSRKKYKISENKAIRSNCRNYLNRHWTVNFLNFFLLKICIDCVQPVQILTYLPIIFFFHFYLNL